MDNELNSHEDFTYKKLRSTIDDLRLENQAIRMELERYKAEIEQSYNLQYYLNKFFRYHRKKLKQKAKRLHKKTFKVDNASPAKDNFSSNFTPYKVRIQHQLQVNRPNVLHVVGNFYTGGSSQLIVDLIERLGHKYHQTVITRDYPKKEGYVGLNIAVYSRFTSINEVVSLLKNAKPDLIHVHYLGEQKTKYGKRDWAWYNTIFEAARICDCRIIENINIPTEPYISNRVDYYVYVSDYVKREYGNLHCKNVTIYPGSDVSFFSRKNAMPVANDCIGMVYRLEGDKLNEHSIDVFIKAVQKRPGTKAIIVGGGTNLNLFQDKVRQAGLWDAFTFTGYISYKDLPALYEKMSVFVAPVHRESFGQVTPFAMAMELPVVGYDVGAIGEIVNNPYLLAPAEDSDALAAIIVNLLEDEDKRKEIGQANRKRAEELFSVETMINNYDLLYTEIITSKK